MEKKIVKNQIEINANPGQVWDALVNPEKTRLYMFNCVALSDWKPGSRLDWQAEVEGKPVVFVTGFIKEFSPATKLVFTVTDPFAGWADVPENYLTVQYELENTATGTILTVSQYGFEGAAEGEKRYRDVYNNGEGWNPILIAIKQLVEQTGAATS